MQKVSSTPYLTRDERNILMKKNDWLASFNVMVHWTWIIMAFVIVWVWPSPFTVFVTLWILGGKQLACAILMHDASHNAMFESRKINEFIGEWLGAFPIFHNLKYYRPYHLLHHQKTGLPDDPDLFLTRGYPTTRKSMFRKFFRDVTGQTGIKALAGIILMNIGYLEYNLGGKVAKTKLQFKSWKAFFKRFIEALGGPLLSNTIMLLLLYFFASGWLYLLWIGAYLTTFQVCLRVRSMAEHSMVEDPENPMLNTRTTKANLLERLLFAPYHVNYHAEHHMLMGVPSYHLPRMHRIIKKRGYYDEGLLAHNYWEIVRKAAGKKSN